jgi:hypothetical protein
VGWKKRNTYVVESVQVVPVTAAGLTVSDAGAARVEAQKARTTPRRKLEEYILEMERRWMFKL